MDLLVSSSGTSGDVYLMLAAEFDALDAAAPAPKPAPTPKAPLGAAA
jgi:hypothetical protein